MTRFLKKLEINESPWLIVISMAAPVCMYFPVACLRFIDGDEGYYLFASRLVMKGKVLFRGFFACNKYKAFG